MVLQRYMQETYYQECCYKDFPFKNISCTNLAALKVILSPTFREYLGYCAGSLANQMFQFCFSLQILGFPEDARHTPYSFRGQTIAIRYHKVYIFEHV
jgi:hypothetical protein